jgi:hypothetical protein
MIDDVPFPTLWGRPPGLRATPSSASAWTALPSRDRKGAGAINVTARRI